MEEMIEIPLREYKRLLADQRLLDHLHANGVDNWEGYSHPPEEGEGE